MSDATKQLAEALRVLLASRPSKQADHCDDLAAAVDRYGNALMSAEEALAAFDAQQAAPSEQPAWAAEPISKAYARAELAREMQPLRDAFDREAFEAAFVGRPMSRGMSGEYLLSMTQYRWEGWQARAALAQKPAARVALTDEQRRVLLFLLGIGELDGVGYGERPAGEAPYWWRSQLRAAFPGITAPATQEKQP